MDIFTQLLLNSIIAGAMYSISAMGFSLTFGAARFLNVAHGAVAAVAGYAVFFFSVQLKMNFAVSIVLGICCAAAVGWLTDRFVFRPLRHRKASSLVMVVASLGLMIALQAVLAMLFTSQFRTIGGYRFSSAVPVGNGAITWAQLAAVILGVVIFAGLMLILKRTQFGRAVRAVSDDEEVARIVGIDTDAVIGKVFLLGSALAGTAAILVGIDTGLQPTMVLVLLLTAAVSAIIGGIKSVPGAFLGAYLLGFVENFGIWRIGSEWKWTVVFVLLILFLIFRPQGILGKK